MGFEGLRGRIFYCFDVFVGVDTWGFLMGGLIKIMMVV